ncbi:hypothetical protein [Terrabacter tumescens]|nr:hypothetical protein [Terrabacter tumescens]
MAVHIVQGGSSGTSVEAELTLRDRDYFKGTASNSYVTGAKPEGLSYHLSKDGRSLELSTVVVTGPTSAYERYEDVGLTSISLALRCRK